MSLGSVGKNISAVNQIAKSQPQVLQAIQQAASKTGVDFAYLVKKAGVESSFNPTAKASTSSATGLYQFVQGTWLDMVDRHGANYGLANEAAAIERGADGRLTVKDKTTRDRILSLRNDPQIAAVMAAEYAAENTSALKAKVGGKIGATEMYLAHFLGSAGAGTLLGTMKNRPNMPASAVLPDAAAANRNVFYTNGGRARTVTEVYNHFAAKFDGKQMDVAAAQAPVLAPRSVKPVDDVAPVKVAPVQVLAVITPEENYSVAAAQPAAEPAAAYPIGKFERQQVALLTPPTGLNEAMQGMVASDSLFRAMQFAEQLLDSNGHLSQRQARERESASRLFG